MSGPATAGGVNPEREAFIASYLTTVKYCAYIKDCRPKDGKVCRFPHTEGEARKRAGQIWRNKTDANRVAANKRKIMLSNECRAIEACKRCVNGEACGCTALPVAHELAREEMVFQIKILPCPHFVRYGECAHKYSPNTEGWSCKNYCHPEDDIEAMHAKLAAQGWKNTRWESKTRDTLMKMGVDETPQIMARLDMFRLKTAESAEDELTDDEVAFIEECYQEVLDGETNLPGMNDGPDEVVVDWDEVDAEFAEFEKQEEEDIDWCLCAFQTFADVDNMIRKQEELSAQMMMLRAEEQRWIEACAQEEAARAARRSFAAVCRIPVVSSPPAPQKVATVVPAVKGAPPTLGTVQDLEEDSRDLSTTRWWGDVCMDN